MHIKTNHINSLTFYAMLFLAIGVCTSITVSALYHALLIVPFIYYFKDINFREWSLNQKALALMIVMVILSVIFNQDIAAKGYEPITKVKYYIFGLIAIIPIQKWFDSLNEEDRIKKIRILIWALLLATTFSGLYGISRLYFNFNPFNLKFSDATRNTGVVGMVLNFAHDLAFVLIFITSLLFSKKLNQQLISKKWLILFLILNLVVMYTTFARGAFIAYLFALPFVFISNKKVFVTMIVSFLVFGSLGILYLSKTNFRAGSDEERISQWKTAIVAFKERPILGQGYLNFEKVCPALKVKYDIDIKRFCGHAHNIFLEALASTGILGFATMIVWLISWTYALIKRNDILTEFTIPLIVVFVVGGMTQATFTLGANLFAIMFFYTISQLKYDTPVNHRF